MKRAREENIPGPERSTGPLMKRSTIVRGETSSHHVRSGAAPRCLTTEDAHRYLAEVKEAFKDKNGRYDEFLALMKGFKAHRIDTLGVIVKVKEIFKDHHHLLLGFNTFLPRGYEIKLPVEEEILKKPAVEFGHAITYVNKIKTRFQHDEHVYHAFLEILYMYRKGNKYIQDVYDEVACLFREHQDLLEEFTHFLPAASGVAHPTHKRSGTSMTRRDEKVSASPAPKLSQPEKLVKREKTETMQTDRDSSFAKHSDKHIQGGAININKDWRKRDRDERERDNAENNTEDEQDSQLLSYNPKYARKAQDILCVSSQVGKGGESYVGLGLPGPPLEKKIPKNLQRKLAFFEKLKTRLGNNETYQEFLKCLNMYSEEIISRKDLHNLVGDLLGGFKDLLEGFNDFLSYCERNGFGDGMPVKPKVEQDGIKEKAEKDIDKERGKDGGDEKRDLEKTTDKDKLASQPQRDSPILKAAMTPSKDKYLMKPISELDLSGCKSCTPSYRCLPKNYPKPTTSLRSEWAYSVLNDKWVSRTFGSEDYSFKHMRKNQYEESIFLCEDDRFELDMLLETTAATTRLVEELLQKLRDANSTQNGQIHLEDYLKGIHLRCIERIYGDHGLDALDLLRKNVPVTLPVILCRLKQKQEEWTKCRADMNKIWAEVYAKNYDKSLDHRSFYFKQQDKKSLSTKALLAEVKEISQKKQRDDDFILSIAAGNSRTHSPDLNFEYVDKSIHNDVYRIIKYSANEMCSSMEQRRKVMKLLTSFLEPFFGLPARAQGLEDAENVVHAELSEVKAHGFADGAVKSRLADGKASCKRHLSLKHQSFLPNNHTKLSTRNKTGISGSGSEPLLVTEKNPCLIAFLGSSEQLHGLGNSSSKANDLNSCWDDQSAKVVNINLTGSGKDAEYTVSKINITGKDAGDEVSLETSNCRVEREEGELSPSPELEERHTNTGHSSKVDQVQLFGNCLDASAHFTGNQPDEDNGDHLTEAEGQPDEDAEGEGEESRQKSGGGEDRGNSTESGEENFVTESGDGDDIPENHEDEEEAAEFCEKNESESEAEEIADNCKQGKTLPSWDTSLHSCMPLRVRGPSIVVEQAPMENSTVFYGNDNLYILFRLHQTLYERILSAKINAKGTEQKWNTNKDGASPDMFEKFMQILYSLLDGSVDNTKFEDECRAIIGTQSYVLFTLDKLIYKLVKQLQSAAYDEMVASFFALNAYEKCRRSDGFIDAVYYANANVLSHDENLYRFEHVKNSDQLFIQLIEDRTSEKSQLTANAVDQSVLKYLSSFLVSAAGGKKENGIFMSRNKHHLYGRDDCISFAKAMRNVFLANGLEYKISCNSSKVSYVLDTRDVFYRKHRKRKLVIIGRVQKFRRWQDYIVEPNRIDHVGCKF